MWYCVLQLGDYRMLYLGQDESDAWAANVPGTYLAESDSELDALRVAARDVNRWRQDQRLHEGSDWFGELAACH